MNEYFSDYPERKWCRYSKPNWLDYLDDLLGDRLATGSASYSIGVVCESTEDVAIDPELHSPSEESTTPSSSSLVVRSREHKRAASASSISGRPAKTSMRQRVGDVIEDASTGMQQSIEQMIGVLKDNLRERVGQNKSSLQRAIEILNTKFTNLSPAVATECSDVLSIENRAEVFRHIRSDCQSQYINTILRREGSNTTVLSDDELDAVGDTL